MLSPDADSPWPRMVQDSDNSVHLQARPLRDGRIQLRMTAGPVGMVMIVEQADLRFLADDWGAARESVA